MIENWVYSLFFCAGELWGGVVISVLFWSLANEVCTVSDAKTIYPLMGIAANIALVVAGNYMKWINKTVTQVSTSEEISMLHVNDTGAGLATTKCSHCLNYWYSHSFSLSNLQMIAHCRAPCCCP